MRKCSVKRYIILTGLMIAASTAAAYANSSWRWISQTRPYDLLPLVIAVTLAVEIWAINSLGKVYNFKKTALWVTAANLISFIAPYLLAGNEIYTIEQTLNHTPFYTVGIFYMLLTMAVELPMVYMGLGKKSDDRGRLIYVIAAANVITTVFTAAVERLICYGVW